MLTATFLAVLLLAALAAPPTPRRIPPLIPALALVAVGFGALLAPGLALAQTTAPASASPGVPAQVLQFVIDHMTWQTALTILGIVAGAIQLSDRRKRQVALGIYHGFHLVEDLVAECDANNKAFPYLSKAAAGLALADQYMRAQGWRPLKPGEQAVAKLSFTAMNAQADQAKELAQTAASVVIPAPAPAPAAAPAPTVAGSTQSPQ